MSPLPFTGPRAEAWCRIAALALFLSHAHAQLASAEEGPPRPEAPAAETRRFGTWELVCERAPPKAPATPPGKAGEAGSAAACKVVQRQVARETGQSVFLVTVLPAGRPDRFAVIVSTPLGGYLAPGMVLSVDRGRPFKVLVETCTTAGCHAGFALAGRIERELRRGRELKVRLWTGKGSPADVAVPLAGLEPALAALRDAR